MGETAAENERRSGCIHWSDREVCRCDRAAADDCERVYQGDPCVCPGQVQRQVAPAHQDFLQLRG